MTMLYLTQNYIKGEKQDLLFEDNPITIQIKEIEFLTNLLQLSVLEQFLEHPEAPPRR